MGPIHTRTPRENNRKWCRASGHVELLHHFKIFSICKYWSNLFNWTLYTFKLKHTVTHTLIHFVCLSNSLLYSRLVNRNRLISKLYFVYLVVCISTFFISQWIYFLFFCASPFSFSLSGSGLGPEKLNSKTKQIKTKQKSMSWHFRIEWMNIKNMNDKKRRVGLAHSLIWECIKCCIIHIYINWIMTFFFLL